MNAFADTSFLLAFYFPRTGSEQAVTKVESLPNAPLISALVRFEFQQAVWFKVWLQIQGHALGLSEIAAQSALAAFEWDVTSSCDQTVTHRVKGLDVHIPIAITRQWVRVEGPLLHRAEKFDISHT